MEGILWGARTSDTFALTWPLFLNLTVCFTLVQADFLFLVAVWLWRLAVQRPDPFVPRGPGERPSALVIIPSLLAGQDDFDAITTTVESAATNGYPGALLIVASVDGRDQHPELAQKLQDWVAQKDYAKNIHVHVTGTPTRLGKMMAVEAGVAFVKGLVAQGRAAEFPALYFSIDGDGTLGPRALERLAHRITTPHRFTGNLRRIVSGKICIRPDLLWQGWRAFFTVKGQLYVQVAREFVVSNAARHNWKWAPAIGVPGALYCTWSELLLAAPRFMGFMQTLRFSDWLRWWVGKAPPQFSESRVEPLPEALTGASDDTCMAFIASIASWQRGRLSLDAPRTPGEAFVAFLLSLTVERSHDYEPEARVYTYSPPTLRGLWRQRVRWNSSRVECAGRFWRAFWYHWEIGFPVSAHLWILLYVVFDVSLYYLLLPYYFLGGSHVLLGYLIGYGGQTVAYAIVTAMALVIESDYRRCWRVVFGLPLAAFYCIAINFLGCATGVIKDVFLFGNPTNFAPEWTLMKGRCERIAILFRLRRFFLLCVRSWMRGDVPLGWFWLGWAETPWTPSGYEGWTTGRKPRSILG